MPPNHFYILYTLF